MGGLMCASLVLGGYFQARLAIARNRAPAPEGILVLGGGHQRERLAAELGQQHPELPIWISSGIASARSCRLFQDAGIDSTRVRRDRRAVDTVTNFTSLADDLATAGVEHVYVVTNDYHRSRSAAIATVVLGSRGIAFTFATFPRPDLPPESRRETLRDLARSLLWFFTGHAGVPLRSARDWGCPSLPASGGKGLKH